MDEVDFTILAATSVLGDLIEKCPPAEACRDAFDRMSKATVQMCMSTTGFGSSAQGLSTRRKSHGAHAHSHTHNNSNESSPDYFNSSNKAYARQTSSRRPKPQFDMGLEHLLGSQNSSSMSTPQGFSNNNGLPSSSSDVKTGFDFSTSATPRQNPSNSQQQNQTTSPSDYAISPPLSTLDTSSIDPSLLPSPQPQNTSSPLNTQTSLPTAQGPAFSQAVQSTYATNPYQEMQFPFTNALGMDFLNSGNWDGGGANGAGGWSGDMGMGMGWEGVDGHDFSEGGNGGVDLFEGFFFGGTGNF